MAEVNLPIIIGASLIDGINPCAFGVLIFLLAYLSKNIKDRRMMLSHGLIYILAVFITYLAAGLFLLPVIRQLGSLSVGFYILIGVLVVLAGLIEIKDFFYYGRGFSLSIFPNDVIKMYVNKVGKKLWTAFFLGVFVALVELPCTGAVYLAVLTLMTLAGIQLKYILFLVLYNLIFVLPLIVILWLFVRGVSANKFKTWHQKHKALMRLLIGLVLIGMGAWMLATVL
ncbi:hypothetical protein HYT58_02440 [Candidatus Woesearchaeota archaeon]|nr:hypothetical protein [Candidatus Woesearchaeota archaeon]